jgi:hypothetical protein
MDTLSQSQDRKVPAEERSETAGEQLPGSEDEPPDSRLSGCAPAGMDPALRPSGPVLSGPVTGPCGQTRWS